MPVKWPMRSQHALLILLALPTLSACDSVPLLAPTGSTVMLVASQAVVSLDGETTITASVAEGAGTPVQNGTEVTFSTTLGALDSQQASTRDGRASVRLLAGSVAGTATVDAFSGSATADTIFIQIGTSAP